MSGVDELILQHVRSHERSHFKFTPKANAIVGPNGSGKTTIIEVLHTLFSGKSFKSPIKEMVTHGNSSLHASAKLHSGDITHTRSVGVQVSGSVLQKKWSVDDKKFARLPLTQQLPLVLFEPEFARLITGGPERRRSYLDQITSQLNVEVARDQRKLDRVLRQRNQLLKDMQKNYSSRAPSDLFAWNTQIAHLAERVVGARIDLLHQLQDEIDAYYKELGGEDSILLTYKSSVTDDPAAYGSKLLSFLEASLQRDVVMGYTNFGPHRDDMAVQLADQPASQRASRGEVRTIVIALKLLETELLTKQALQHNFRPILLLDDVLSELDLVHQERVLSGFKDHQVFITTTDAHALDSSVNTIALGVS